MKLYLNKRDNFGFPLNYLEFEQKNIKENEENNDKIIAN